MFFKSSICCLFLGITLAAQEFTVPVCDPATVRGVAVNGAEFPGAKGTYSVEREAGECFHRVTYNLNQGHYYGVDFSPAFPEGSSILKFDLRSPAPELNLMVLTVDSAGQTQLRNLPQTGLTPEEWRTVTLDLNRFDAAWGGKAPEKRIHWPVRTLRVAVKRDAARPEGRFDLRNFTVLVTPPEAKTGPSIPVCNTEQTRTYLNIGPEFPGAKAEYKVETQDGELVRTVNYDLTKGQYAGINFACELPEQAEFLTFKVKTAAPKLNLTLITVDDDGRYQLRRRDCLILKKDEWQTVMFNLQKYDASWGGRTGEDRIHWPLRRFQIAQNRDASFPTGAFRIKDIRVAANSDSPERQAGFTPSVSPQRFGGLYRESENPAFQFDLFSGAPERNGTFLINATVSDWRGRKVFDWERRIPAAQRFAVEFPKERFEGKYGAFRADFTIRSEQFPAHIRHASGWIGRLPPGDPAPCPWIGTQIHPDLLPPGDLRLFDIMKAVGIGCVRSNFWWAQVEKEKGVYQVPQFYENLLEAMTKNGIRLSLTLGFGNSIYDNQLDPDAFAAYCSFMAKHFKGRIDRFEIWNEPQNFVFPKHYGGSLYGASATWLPKFIDLTAKASAAIRKIQPEAVVACCSGDFWPTLKQMIEEGIGGTGDPALRPNVVSIHPYCHGQPRPEREMFFRDNGKELRALCKKYGAPERFIITEAGWTTYEREGDFLKIFGGYPRASFVQQAQYVTRLFLAARAEGIEYVIQYDFHNDGPRRDYTEHNFGLTFEDYSPKPALLAVATLARMVGNLPYAEDLSGNPDEYRIYRFSGSGRDVIAAYAIEKPVEITLPAGKDIAVADLSGNPVKADVRNGKLHLELTEEPVYITGADCDALKRTVRLRTASATPAPAWGDTLKQELEIINNTGRDGLATIDFAVTVPGRGMRKTSRGYTASIPAGRTIRWTAEFPFGKEWQPFSGEEVVLDITASLNGTEHTVVRHATLHPPFTAEPTNLLMHDGVPSIGIALQYFGGRDDELRITDAEHGFSRRIPVRNGYRGTVWIPFKARPEHLNIEVAGTSYTRNIDLKPVDSIVRKLASPPGEDGAGAWINSALPVPCRPRAYVMLTEPWGGEDDLSAQAWIAYGKEGIYVAARVRDNRFFQPYTNQPSNAWAGDALQITFSRLNPGRDFLEFTVADFGDRTVCPVTIGLADKSADYSKISAISRKVGDNGRFYQVFIPWKALPFLKGEAGETFRFAMIVNDNDGAGRKGFWEFHGGIGGGEKQPDLFGVYSLGEK